MGTTKIAERFWQTTFLIVFKPWLVVKTDLCWELWVETPLFWGIGSSCYFTTGLFLWTSPYRSTGRFQNRFGRERFWWSKVPNWWRGFVLKLGYPPNSRGIILFITKSYNIEGNLQVSGAKPRFLMVHWSSDNLPTIFPWKPSYILAMFPHSLAFPGRFCEKLTGAFAWANGWDVPCFTKPPP